jgi:hypothetical protein
MTSTADEAERRGRESVPSAPALDDLDERPF